MTTHADDLPMPETMPKDFADFVRAQATGLATAGFIKAKLEVIPEELWHVADAATAGSIQRSPAFADLWNIILDSTALLPTQTVSEKADSQRSLAAALATAQRRCENEAFSESADLKELLALSAAHQAGDPKLVSAVAALLYKMGTGNSGVTLRNLLGGLSDALYLSADQLREAGDDLYEKAETERYTVRLSGSATSQYRSALAKAQGARALGRIRSSDSGQLVFEPAPVPSHVVLQVQTQMTEFTPEEISCRSILYGRFEPVHPKDFPRSPPKPQENHIWVATGLIRWMRTYAGKPNQPLVRQVVEALCGHRDDDFMKQASRKATRTSK